MAYLRGNTVIDGNLFVEGSITYSGVRPDITDSVSTYKGDEQGMVHGRILKCGEPSTGILVDSSLRENVTTYGDEINNQKTVDFYFDLNSNQNPHTNNDLDSYSDGETEVRLVRVMYPVYRLTVISRELTPIYEDINGDEGYSEDELVTENIVSWTYAIPPRNQNNNNNNNDNG